MLLGFMLRMLFIYREMVAKKSYVAVPKGLVVLV